MQIGKLSDKDVINYYKTEFFSEWYLAYKNGINLTASDIRARLNLL